MRACSGSSGSRLKSPVMIVAAGRANAWNGPPSCIDDAADCAHSRCLRRRCARSASTCAARLRVRVVLEMRGDHAHGAERASHARPRRAMRGMPARRDRAGYGSRWRNTCRTGRRDRIMLPKRRRRAVARRAWSTATPGIARVAGQAASRARANWFSPPAAAEPRIGKVVGDLLQAEHVEVGDALAHRATMRAGSTLPSTPRHHCTFQVMSFIGSLIVSGCRRA